MPGLDSKRFTNITELEKDQFMCGICLGVVNNPFVVKCCKQLYCYDCINEWLRCSNTCPHDRSQLGLQDLQKSEQYSKSMENLEIHCEYERYGCEVIIKLKNLPQHLKNCVYNPERKCNVCGLMIGDINKHNCIELLIEEKEKFKQENMILKSKIDQYRQRMFDDERHCWDNPLWCI